MEIEHISGTYDDKNKTVESTNNTKNVVWDTVICTDGKCFSLNGMEDENEDITYVKKY